MHSSAIRSRVGPSRCELRRQHRFEDRERHTPEIDIDRDTGARTRAALERLLARADASLDCIVMIIADDATLPIAHWRRMALQIAAVVPDPDCIFRCRSRSLAVALNASEARLDTFLAERIRLMVAAMPASAPAPTVTVATVPVRAGLTLDGIEAHCRALPPGRNRVVSLVAPGCF